MHKKYIKYFKDCYQADNRDQNIWDIFSAKINHLYILNQSEQNSLQTNQNINLEKNYAIESLKSIETFRREKEYIFAQYFVISKIQLSPGINNKQSTICAPLIYSSADIQLNAAGYHFFVNRNDIKLNINLLRALIDNQENLEVLENYLLTETFNFQSLYNLLKSFIPEDKQAIAFSIDTTDINLLSLKKNANKESVLICDSSAFMLVQRSIASRGIVDELTIMSQKKQVSNALKAIFLCSPLSKLARVKVEIDNVPGILSLAQSTALKNATKHIISMVVGPPGTGKSYTIACLVVEAFMRGEKILVVSQNEHAIDVIHHKLTTHLGVTSSAIVRAGSKEYLNLLKIRIQNLLQGIGLERPTKSKFKELKAKIRQNKKLEYYFRKISKKLVADGIYLAEGTSSNPSYFSIFKLWFIKRRIDNIGLLQAIMSSMQKGYKERELLLSNHINNEYLIVLNKLLNLNRKELINFSNAIKARNSSKQENIFSKINYSILLNAMPVWLSSLSTLHRVLPLDSEMFDLVIFDEATQCDIASSLPALYRAKRAVVVGDPKQLRHISFLSKTRQSRIAEINEIGETTVDLNYRNSSLIDFANASISEQNAVVMLDEHYRSAPDIIMFSNQYFYNNSLKVLTESPLQHALKSNEILLVSDGKQENGSNINEAKKIILKIKELVEEQNHLPNQFKLSIGVVSFFRKQAELIQKLIFDEFDLDVISQHEIRAGTPYGFQGEERDIILLSCVIDADIHSASYNYINRADVFNVAITRARELQLVFVSTTQENIPKSSLLWLYLNSILKNKTLNHPTNQTACDRINEVVRYLEKEKMQVYLNYPIAGIHMDLMVTLGSFTIAIDLIGFPGKHQNVFSLEHYKLFERAGLLIFPISYSAWHFKKVDVIERIKQEFHALKNNRNITAIAIQEVNNIWSKLLLLDVELAKNVKEIEYELISLNSEKIHVQLKSVVEQYLNAQLVLDSILDQNELTYAKYSSQLKIVVEGVVACISKITFLSKNIKNLSLGNTDTEQTKSLITSLSDSVQIFFENNERAIFTLKEMASRWSLMDLTSKNSFDLESNIKELQRLNTKIKDYSI